MRIADNMTFDQVRGNIGKNRAEMSDLQNQAATQKRVVKPSDDPVAAARVLATRVDLSGNRQYSKNLNYARSFLEYTDQSLGDLTDNLVRLKELALSQANDASANDESRRVVATEVGQIYEQMLTIANRKLGERFIFGGYRTTSRPFDMHGNYEGDQGEMMIGTDKGAFIAMNLPGSKVFLGDANGIDGVNSALTRQATTIEEFQENQEKIKAKQENQSLEAPVNSEEGSAMRGPASLPEPSSQTASGDSAASGLNLFAVAKRLETALVANDKEIIQDTLDSIDAAISQVVMARSQVGSRGMVLDSVMMTLEKAKMDNQILISQMEDADVFKTMSDITRNESTLQATLQTSGKLVQPSLLDFLR